MKTRHRRPRELTAVLLVLMVAGWSCRGGKSDGNPQTAVTESGGAPPQSSASSGTATQPTGPGVPQTRPALGLPREDFPDPVLEALRTALDVYEKIRQLLARDRLEGVPREGDRLVTALRQAVAGSSNLSSQLQDILQETGRTAESLAKAEDLNSARSAFGEVSRLFILLSSSDPRLREGRYIFECPMTPTFRKWFQTGEKLENPYMGKSMPSCGSPTNWSVSPPTASAEIEAHAEHAHGGGDVAYYTCSMHPSVKSKTPGTCPICSMNLVPVTRREVETGVILVDAQRRQLIGVRTAPLERRPVSVTIRAVGKLGYDQTRLADVSLKYRGWIGKLYVNEPGQRVRKGEPLFTLYSPELYAAQEELLAARESQKTARDTSAPDRADYLVEAARIRLRLWDIQDWQVDEIAKGGKPLQYVPIVSPVSGYVTEKNVVEGTTVEPGMKLYRIAGLDKVWVEAEVYEWELPLVHVGQEAEVILPYIPGQRFRGRVSFVYPYLEDASRTGRVRVELANPGLRLKPDMYASVELIADRGLRTVVPVSAVLYAGPRRLVFVDLGEGRLRPQEIQVGVRSGDYYEVLSGVEEGDVVVTSGNFLISAESRLKSATEIW